MKGFPDLHNAYRLECKSKKPQRLNPDFYLHIREELKENERAATALLDNKDLEAHIAVRSQIGFYRRDLMAFLEKRLEKILLMSLYDLKDSEIRFLQEEEDLRLAVRELTQKFTQEVNGGELP